MTNDGRVAFTTSDALVPQDTDGVEDVYEFVDSRPRLISSGTSQRSVFEGNAIYPPAYTGLESFSANGVDLYFSTYDTLTPQDHNGPFIKFYDARTNGGFPIPPPLQPCVAADECHGTGSATPAEPQVGTGADLGAGGNEQPAPSKKAKKGQARAEEGLLGEVPQAPRPGIVTATPLDGEPQWLIWTSRGRTGRSPAVLIAGAAALFLFALMWLSAGDAQAYKGINAFSTVQSDTQAGGHPDIEVHAKFDNRVIKNGEFLPPLIGGCGCDDPEIIDIQFPTGFIGDPHAVPKCTLALFSQQACAPESQVGVLNVGLFGGYTPIYNMEPHENEAGLLGFQHPDRPRSVLHRPPRADRQRLRPQRDERGHLPPAPDQRTERLHVGHSLAALPRQIPLPDRKTVSASRSTTRIPATHRSRRTARRRRSWRTRPPATPTSPRISPSTTTTTRTWWPRRRGPKRPDATSSGSTRA